MCVRRVLASLVLTLAVVLGITVSSSGGAVAAPQAGSASPNIAWYRDGAVITYDKWGTAVIGASSAFTGVWVAASTLNGQAGNKMYQSIWYIQAIAAYTAARGQCLWVWVTYDGKGLSAGSYSC